MEEIKPKKERKFLKAIGKVAGILLQEFVLGLGRKFIGKKIDRIGNKRQALLIFLALFCNIAFASIDSIPYPISGNKQRLGWQTSGNGLVWRGVAADTVTKPTNYVDKNVKAYLILDSVSGSLYVFKQGAWAAISGSGGGLTMPFDSITFNTAKDGTVGVGEVEYNDTQGSLIQGLKGGNVTNVIGQQLHQRVNNRTGSTLAKGTVVYLSGSQGNRITVAKALATSDPTSANTFGIVAEEILDNASGYVITEGLITNINTSALTQDSAVYLSGTTAGALTSTKPQAPIHGVYIGVCVKSNAGSGELFVKIRNGQELDELHDVQISSPVDRASLYYKSSEGLWRDTTAALLVSDTAAMLANYALKGYVDSISQNFQDSIDEITNGYFKQEFASVTKDTLNWTKPVQLPIGGSNLLLVYRNGQMINDAQYSVIDTNKVKINSGSYKVGENYTVVYVKGGGGSGSGGVPFDTSVLNLQARLDLKLNISDTASMLSNYATKAYADTTGRFYARQDFSNVTSSTLTWTQSDTLVTGGVNVVQVYRNGQILLPSQYTIPSSTSVVIAATSYKAGENYTVIFPRGGGAGSGGGSGSLTSISAGTGITVSPNPITTTGTVSADLTVLMELTDTASLSNRINLKLNATDTASLSNRINAKLNISDTASMLSPYFRDADTTLLNLTSRFSAKQNTLTLTTTGTSGAATLTGATLNIPQYSGGGGGSGTVTSVGSGYGITGGPITTTGTLTLDSATVYDFVRDSIVDVQIGNDTIKILKQEYNPALSDTLTWTVTSKFPIQLRAYILLFRNGQLLINDQYSIIDTNKIKVAASSYKVGENYTVVTVSGIGSVSSGQGNPVYPEAGIALSTGTTWTTSIPNNSTNWNTAFTDRLKWDGGSTGLVAATGRTSLGGTTIGQSMFTLTNPSAISFPQFNADNTITALSSASFRGAIGAGTVTSVTASGTSGNPISITNTTTTPVIELLSATSGRNGYLTSTDWTTFNNKQSALSFTLPLLNTSNTISINDALENGTTKGVSTYNGNDFNAMSGVISIDYTNAVSASGSSKGFLLPADWTTFNNKQSQLNGTGFVKASGTSITYDNSTYLTTSSAASTYLPLTGGTLTGALSGTSGTFTSINANNSSDAIIGLQPGDNNLASKIQFKHFGTIRQEIIKPNSTGNLQFRSYPTGTATGGYEFYVSNGSAESLAATIGTDKSLSLTGTLAVTGATTLSNLAGTGNRMVIAGSGGALSTQAIPTGTVTNVTGTLPISVATGTTTPSITIANASASADGVVNTQTQTFAGYKTFNDGINTTFINTNYYTIRYRTVTSATSTVASNDIYLNCNRSGTITLTLPSAASFPGRLIYIKTINNNVISNIANVIPLAGGNAGQAILDATAGKWCTLMSDGTDWIIIQAN